MPYGETLNCKVVAKPSYKVHGMIDAHAHHNSLATWPKSVQYRTAAAEKKTQKKLSAKMPSVDEENIEGFSTKDIGDKLVGLNTVMYNVETQGLLCDDGKYDADIPSFVIVSTADMEFAQSDGFYCDTGVGGCSTRNKLAIREQWDKQIKNTESAVESHPLRLFPLYSYDPRRYQYIRSAIDINKMISFEEIDDRVNWIDPFARIVGYVCNAKTNDKRIKCGKTIPEAKQFWIGFSMNPQFGFKPLDGRCACLKDFYEECLEHAIPILAHCAPEGITAKDADKYMEQDTKYIDKDRPIELKYKYQIGEEYELSGNYKLDYFYKNYVHPDNWLPVLEKYKKLRLCLAHFGGNSEWRSDSVTEWANEKSCTENNCEKCDKCEPLERPWIKSIVRLTKEYQNVYTDISGLNISDPKIIVPGLRKMLEMIHGGHEEYKHLKYKLIFGSNWYYSSLAGTKTAYKEYCKKFKEIFDDVDRSGELWERVSLINPWEFYAFSDGEDKNNYKINKIYNALKKDTNGLDERKNEIDKLIEHIKPKKRPSGDNSDNSDNKKTATNADKSRNTFTQDELKPLWEVMKRNFSRSEPFACIVFVHRVLQSLLATNDIIQNLYAMYSLKNMMGDVEALGYTDTDKKISIGFNRETRIGSPKIKDSRIVYTANNIEEQIASSQLVYVLDDHNNRNDRMKYAGKRNYVSYVGEDNQIIYVNRNVNNPIPIVSMENDSLIIEGGNRKDKIGNNKQIVYVEEYNRVVYIGENKRIVYNEAGSLSEKIRAYVNSADNVGDKDGYYVFAMSIFANHHTAILAVKVKGEDVRFNIFDQADPIANRANNGPRSIKKDIQTDDYIDHEINRLLVWYNDVGIDIALLMHISRRLFNHKNDFITIYPLYKKKVLR